MDAKLDANDDLDVTTGDLVLLTGAEAVAQELRIRFRFFLGEWFLDRRLGIPYYERILIKNPATNVVRSLLREVALETPGVLELQEFRTDFDNAARRLTVTLSARVDDSDATLDFSQAFVIG